MTEIVKLHEVDNGESCNIYIRRELLDFAIQMEKSMSENDEKKGDSWMGMKIGDLLSLKEIKDAEVDLFKVYGIEDNPDYLKALIEQANYNMMIWNSMIIMAVSKND